MIKVTDTIWLDESELKWDFIRAGGPGGQHVNKAATAVQLRFEAASSGLPSYVKTRLKALAGQRMTAEGEIVIIARASRSQEQNRHEALDKLVDLIRQASIVPKARRKTRPSVSSKERRLKEKSKRAVVKKMRKKGGEE
ncbi:MAG: peptide chain release factor I [Deltaproteobacteria bacterium GWA2_55_10]|nr:MAG: peptide chain release factor I [Deltaproteobacteria bacterium GWA2_55_10]